MSFFPKCYMFFIIVFHYVLNVFHYLLGLAYLKKETNKKENCVIIFCKASRNVICIYVYAL